jgi:hypothetical protein
MSEDKIGFYRRALTDTDLYLKALSSVLVTLRLDLEQALRAVGAAEESSQKALGAIQDSLKGQDDPSKD